VVAHGAESMAADLAGRRGLTLEHAHGWLRHVGLLTPIDDVDGDPEIVLEARHVLTDAVGRIADEVRNSLDYYTMQEAASPVQRAVLTGPAVAIPGFSDQLATELAIPLEAGIIAEARAGAGGADAGSLAVAAGLTAEEVPA
jgi:type IV pilus assembly protein PilM